MKVAALIGLLFLGSSAMALDFEMDFELIQTSDQRSHECLKKAWDDTTPTDKQKVAAGYIVAGVKRIYEQRRPEIVAAQARLGAVLERHPIPPRRAGKALKKLVKAAAPVTGAFFHGQIAVVNLLSKAQREIFNKSFAACKSSY